MAHRIVHGGERFREAVLIDAAVTGELDALTDLAPLHQPKSLAALDAVIGAAARRCPAVACFDTAFHATLPPAACTYACRAAGASAGGCAGTASTACRTAGWPAACRSCCAGPPAARIVSCHLGAGASLCAIADGRSVDTTMGFTPLEGLVMATRSGSVDPGLLLWLLEREAV